MTKRIWEAADRADFVIEQGARYLRSDGREVQIEDYIAALRMVKLREILSCSTASCVTIDELLTYTPLGNTHNAARLRASWAAEAVNGRMQEISFSTTAMRWCVGIHVGPVDQPAACRSFAVYFDESATRADVESAARGKLVDMCRIAAEQRVRFRKRIVEACKPVVAPRRRWVHRDEMTDWEWLPCLPEGRPGWSWRDEPADRAADALDMIGLNRLCEVFDARGVRRKDGPRVLLRELTDESGVCKTGYVVGWYDEAERRCTIPCVGGEVRPWDHAPDRQEIETALTDYYQQAPPGGESPADSVRAAAAAAGALVHSTAVG